MESQESVTLKEKIRAKAAELGFEATGFAKAERLEAECQLQEWLDSGFHAGMGYMENHRTMRLDPTLLVDEAKTVITLLYCYNLGGQQHPQAPKVARYAWFRDYHKELKQRMKFLMKDIETEVGHTVDGRYFTDSAPVLERSWAQRSGLGWIGKNSMLIHPDFGSFTLLAELIINLEIEPDKPFNQVLCGTCTRCIDSCPTKAIVSPGVVNANRCISYLSIEHKGDFTPEQQSLIGDHAFGCDICQNACPWNKKPASAEKNKAALNADMLALTPSDWKSMSQDSFEKIFAGSAVKRAGYSGIIRNLSNQKQ